MWTRLVPEERHKIPNIKGLYALYTSEGLVYIGRSQALRDRVAHHLRTRVYVEYREEIVEIKYRPVTSSNKALIRALERRLVFRLKPVWNKHCKYTCWRSWH